MDEREENAPALSIIIPTLDEARSIGATLDAVARDAACAEVIVVDGGSRDATVEIARGRGAKVVNAGRGRGRQMCEGANAARGRVLWFLHADTLPSPGCVDAMFGALEDPSVAGGNFDVLFDGGSRAARFLTWLYPQLRKLGLCYGDSGIFARREAYRSVGGFRDYPIFEDLDFVRRLRRVGRVAHLRARVETSSRRFEGRSFALTFARWSLLQALYWLGVSPHTLARMYAHVRVPGLRKSPRTTHTSQTDAGSEEA